MLYYFECLLFFIVSVVFVFLLGTALFYNKNKNESARIVYGYIIHEFLIAIIGIPVQLLKLPYIIFYLYVIVLDVVLLIFSIYRIKKYNIKLLSDKPLNVIKNNWFIILVLALLMLMSVAYIGNYWMGNMQDDGYYVNKVAILPFSNQPFTTVPATGYNVNGMLSYDLMTGELESSVYANILHIDVSVYLRLFLSAFRLFIYLNIVLAFINKVFEKKKFKFDKSLLQYILLIILVFNLPMDYLISTNLFKFQDSWQFNSAMYYGSMVIRTIGFYVLLYPFIDKEKITIKDGIIYGMISTVMVTKSAVSLPVVIIVGISYLVSHYMIEGNKKQRIIIIMMMMFLLFISLLLKNDIDMDKHILSVYGWHFHSIAFWIATLGFISGFFIKSKTINKINITLIIAILIMVLEPFNNIVATSSIYTFVAARMQAMILYVIIVLGFSYLSFYIFKYIRKTITIKTIYIVLMIGLSYTFITSYETKYQSLIKSYKIIRMNKRFIPNSTIELGKKLEKLRNKEKKELNVITPEWVNANEYEHSLAILLRIYAPHVRVITAVERYEGSGVYKTYDRNEINKYVKFVLYPNNKTFNMFKNSIEKYPANCIVYQI